MLLEIPEELLYHALGWCEVRTLLELLKTRKQLRVLARQVLNSAQWRTAERNADAVLTAMWSSGAYSTRCIGVHSSSINEILLNHDTVLSWTKNDQLWLMKARLAQEAPRESAGYDVGQIRPARVAWQGSRIALACPEAIFLMQPGSATRHIPRLDAARPDLWPWKLAWCGPSRLAVLYSSMRSERRPRLCLWNVDGDSQLEQCVRLDVMHEMLWGSDFLLCANGLSLIHISEPTRPY